VSPSASLLLDEKCNLYGTAVDGGDLSCNPTYGCGVVFKISHPDGADFASSQEGVGAAGDETTEGPRVVLPEDVQKLFPQRRGFGRFGGPLVGP